MIGKSIGVFDSGLGGLTAVKELVSILPNENIVYFGDTSRVPYGNRSNETITRYAIQDISFLETTGVKLIIAACGTVSSVAVNIKDKISVPFTGVVKPTSASAVNATKNGKIGVIGTTATIKSSSYKKEIKLLNPDVEIFEQDCPLFVPLVESGFIYSNDRIVNLTVERYLEPLRVAGVDTLILGCTHYPIISQSISNFMGEGVKLINSGRETALFAAKILEQNNLLSNSKGAGECSFYVSDSAENFSNIASLFLGDNIKYSVSQVDIESF